MSTRRKARRLNVEHKTVCHVMHEQQIHPFEPQRVQAMRPEDFASRGHFRRWSLRRSVDDPDFPQRFLFIKPSSPGKPFSFPAAAMFGRMKIRVLCGHGFQQRYSINMRVEFLDGRVTLDTFFHQISRVTRTSFSLNTYCLDSCKMYHCLCVKSCGFSVTAQYLIFSFSPRSSGLTIWRKWLGCVGPISRPTRSPDLIPLDYFMCSHMKSLIY